MRKVCKRTAALLLVVCLLLPMIPAALADTATNKVATKTVEYSFSSYASVFNLTGNISLGGDYGTTLKTAYENGTINSTYFTRYKGSQSAHANVHFRYAYGDFYAATKVSHAVALKFKSPGAGTYDISVLPKSIASGAQKCNVYIYAAGSKTGISSKDIVEANRVTDSLNLCNVGDAQSIGKKTFEAGEDYLIVFEPTVAKDGTTVATVDAGISLLSITMTRSCTDAADAATEMSNAPIGTTVKVDGNLQLSAALNTTADITVSDGAALDLNGQTLTAASVACMGTGIVKDSEDGTGKLSVTTGGCSAVKTDSQLPLTDNGAYRFFNTTVQSLGTTGTDNNKFWFRVSFTNSDAYALAASQMDIGAGLTADEITQVTEAWAGTTFTGTWVTAVNGGTASDICFTAKNFSSLTNFKLTPVVKANGVTVSGAAL